jgi:hypothetical protein
MKTLKTMALGALFATAAVWLSCALGPIATGGTDTETGGRTVVAGAVTTGEGAPASFTQVKLVPRGFNAFTMGRVGDSLVDTTDAHGNYVFKKVVPGYYTVQAVHISQRTRLMIAGKKVEGDTTIVPSGMLQDPGAIRLLLPQAVSGGNGYAYLPGTDIVALHAPGRDEVELDSIPAGTIPEIRFNDQNDSTVVIKLNIKVFPREMLLLANPFWIYAQQIGLNTSASGANVRGDACRFPVLVRLNTANFDFNQAKAHGADIRFTKSDNSFLNYEIERWDAMSGQAEVWVSVDTVHGNDSTQAITMYWGNPNAVDASSSAAVFDTGDGFQGVWHLGEQGNDPARDATGNRYHGNAYSMAAVSSNAGVVGDARVFNGTSSYITMPNTANGRLNFPQEGYYTVSAWVLADTLDKFSHLVVSKGYEQYYLRVTSWTTLSPQWEFVEFNETTKWQTSTFPATGKQWTFLTGVRQGSRQLLYCNGVLVDSTASIWQNAVSRNTSNDLSIGKFLQQVTVPINEGYCFFKGSIDEVRILSTPQSQDWVRLSYMNQRSDDKLVRLNK